MGWADWMIVEQSLEEELELERTIREVQMLEDVGVLKDTCGALLRQNWHQRKLLAQSVERIAEMDAKLACADY